MDRKNLFLALACFGGAFAFYIFGTPRAAGPAATSAPATVAAKAPAPSAAAGKPGATGVAPPTAALAREKAAFVTLENEFIRVTFTTRGGAIERVEMLKEFADTERKAKVIFNQGNPDAALTLVVENRATRAWEQVLGEFKVVAKTDQSLTLAGPSPTAPRSSGSSPWRDGRALLHPLHDPDHPDRRRRRRPGFRADPG